MAHPPKPPIDWAEVAALSAERLAGTIWERWIKHSIGQMPPMPDEHRPKKKKNDPYETLGAIRGLELDDYEALYKARARKLHPDKGGDPEEMKKINAAIKKIREDLQEV